MTTFTLSAGDRAKAVHNVMRWCRRDGFQATIESITEESDGRFVIVARLRRPDETCASCGAPLYARVRVHHHSEDGQDRESYSDDQDRESYAVS